MKGVKSLIDLPLTLPNRGLCILGGQIFSGMGDAGRFVRLFTFLPQKRMCVMGDVGAFDALC